MADIDASSTTPTPATHLDLRGARLVDADLRGATLRAADLDGADIDAPWLSEDGATLLINGVDVVPVVEAELNRRFPGRELRRAADPEALRDAWQALQRAWAHTIDRAASLPDGSVDRQVEGEWSFAQTLRHLVLATDVWLGKAVLRVEQPFHPLGVPNAEYESDGGDMSVFATGQPTFDQVLAAHASRVAMVDEFLATVTPEQLAETRPNPHAPEHPETVLSCLQVILNEGWEHLRFATRDLDSLDG